MNRQINSGLALNEIQAPFVSNNGLPIPPTSSSHTRDFRTIPLISLDSDSDSSVEVIEGFNGNATKNQNIHDKRRPPLPIFNTKKNPLLDDIFKSQELNDGDSDSDCILIDYKHCSATKPIIKISKPPKISTPPKIPKSPIKNIINYHHGKGVISHQVASSAPTPDVPKKKLNFSNLSPIRKPVEMKLFQSPLVKSPPPVLSKSSDCKTLKKKLIAPPPPILSNRLSFIPLHTSTPIVEIIPQPNPIAKPSISSNQNVAPPLVAVQSRTENEYRTDGRAEGRNVSKDISTYEILRENMGDKEDEHKLKKYYKECTLCEIEFESFLDGMDHFKIRHEQKRCPRCLVCITSKGNTYKDHLTKRHFRVGSKNGKVDERITCRFCRERHHYAIVWKHIADRHLYPTMANPPIFVPPAPNHPKANPSIANHQKANPSIANHPKANPSVGYHQMSNPPVGNCQMSNPPISMSAPLESVSCALKENDIGGKDICDIPSHQTKNYQRPLEMENTDESTNSNYKAKNYPGATGEMGENSLERLQHEQQRNFGDLVSERAAPEFRKPSYPIKTKIGQQNSQIDSFPIDSSQMRTNPLRELLIRQNYTSKWLETSDFGKRDTETNEMDCPWEQEGPDMFQNEISLDGLNQQCSQSSRQNQNFYSSATRSQKGCEVSKRRSSHHQHRRCHPYSRKNSGAEANPTDHQKYINGEGKSLQENFTNKNYDKANEDRNSQIYSSNTENANEVCQSIQTTDQDAVDKPTGGSFSPQDGRKSSNGNQNYNERQKNISNVSRKDLAIQFKKSKYFIDRLEERFYSRINETQLRIIYQTKLVCSIMEKQTAFNDHQRQFIDECVNNEKTLKSDYVHKKNFKNDIVRHWAPVIVYATNFDIPVEQALRDFIDASKLRKLSANKLPDLEIIRKMFLSLEYSESQL